MPSSVRSYVGVQGVAAGPIRLGPSGAWIVNGQQNIAVTTRSVTTIPTVAIQRNLSTQTNEAVYLPLQAGLTSIKDDHGVVTVEFLKNYYPSHETPSVDLASYVTLVQFNELYNIVMGTNTSYTNPNSITVRVSALENTVAGFQTTNEALESQMQSISSQVYANSTSIGDLSNRIDNIQVNPFAGESLLIAGGAGPVEAII